MPPREDSVHAMKGLSARFAYWRGAIDMTWPHRCSGDTPQTAEPINDADARQDGEFARPQLHTETTKPA